MASRLNTSLAFIDAAGNSEVRNLTSWGAEAIVPSIRWFAAFCRLCGCRAIQVKGSYRTGNRVANPIGSGLPIVLRVACNENANMISRWYYSFGMLVSYVTLFAVWKFFPSRLAFVGVGGFAIVALAIGMVRAIRSGYFANRIDLGLHIYVIVDLFLETFAFEVFRIAQPYAVVEQFHNNTNFFGCALAFTILIGGYRWFALSRAQPASGAAYGQAGM